MANRKLTEKLIAAIKKHGDQEVLEQLDKSLAEKAIKGQDIDLVACLESDFGPSWRSRIENASDEAMEAIITSGTFNKMAQRVIRFSLQENPREEYKLTNMVDSETRGECEESFKDFGIFSDIEVHEVCELEAGPLYGVSSDYLEHPNGKAVAAGLAFTREAMCKDPNGYIMAQVPKLADAHNKYREEKLIDAFIGYNATYDRSGTLYDVYYAADGSSTPFTDGSSGPWVNAEATTLTCPEDFQTIKDLFYDMTDLVHGRPIEMNTDGLNVITSDQERDRLRPLLLATSVERDTTCPGSGDTNHFMMTPEVANGLTFNPMAYKRLVDKIVARYSVTIAEARKWVWLGDIRAFMAWVYQVRPEVRRLTPSAEEQRKRIVAIYDSYSKGYAYVKNPQKGILLTGASSESA